MFLTLLVSLVDLQFKFVFLFIEILHIVMELNQHINVFSMQRNTHSVSLCL
jgi:hypothetical protein